MSWLIWAAILPLCLVAAYFLLQRPIRLFLEDLHVDQARDTFHRQREHLEARFVTMLGRVDVAEAGRWEEARWHDEVVWARDRQTRRFLALVCVHFEPEPFEPSSAERLATAVFEYNKGRWIAEGKRLDEIRPDEAVGRNRRYEPVAIIQPNVRRVS
ncbi:hypothetical protein OJF2_52520 [Aquisphaera giovannonii]|uniref:Uncharacterized protein n=1 Tax=Aquisphaera giovannonii TaxID=406548 RepID=A0A5B9W8H3_9BACT|nr:hypothetical protein [Aquisphaera giovannonii]QEH36667.1 hypothetical protein OJF2_52520 [Aquisphaera giovannonii]